MSTEQTRPGVVASAGVATLDPPARLLTANLLRSQALALPLAFCAALATFGLLPSVHNNQRLLWSILTAAALLFVWLAGLWGVSRARTFTIEVVFRKQHWVQACAHISLLVYWGWHWHQVYEWAPLIVAQLVFSYAFDMLLTWCRRDRYAFGFGPFPVIFSINLFLWFKPDWFYLQLLMVAIGFAAKELIRWTKEGRRTHIFNPSSFPLAAFSLVLLATHSTDITWGEEIAVTMLHAPYIYFFIFLIGLPGQYFFGVTTMIMSAVATLYGISLVHFAITSTYIFPDEFIPIAIFLGMHLLFTDPSTAPRSELGRIIFGLLYALSVVGLFVLLEHLSVPSFYDKLLAVPILNLGIQRIDAFARSNMLRRIDPARIGAALTPRWRHLAFITLWIIGFVGVNATQVNRPEASGVTALHHAASDSDLLAVRFLLLGGADPNRGSHDGVTPLLLAAGTGNVAVVESLAKAGADPNVSLATSITPLIIAATAGHHHVVRTLIEAGADGDSTDPDGTTAMQLAIINAHFDVAALLLEGGADPNVGDASGMTPVYAAVDMNTDVPGRQTPDPSGKLGALDLVRALLDRGANPNAQLKAPVLMRSYQASSEDAGHRYYTSDSSLGQGATPFMRAASTADLAAMRLLLEHGADPTLVTKDHVTALMFVAGFGAKRSGFDSQDGGMDQERIEAAKLCLKGSDINAVNDEGETALQIAVSQRSERFVKFLTDNGGKLVGGDQRGWISPLSPEASFGLVPRRSPTSDRLRSVR